MFLSHSSDLGAQLHRVEDYCFSAGIVCPELHDYFEFSIGLCVFRPDEEPVNRAVAVRHKVSGVGGMSNRPAHAGTKDAVFAT